MFRSWSPLRRSSGNSLRYNCTGEVAVDVPSEPCVRQERSSPPRRQVRPAWIPLAPILRTDQAGGAAAEWPEPCTAVILPGDVYCPSVDPMARVWLANSLSDLRRPSWITAASPPLPPGLSGHRRSRRPWRDGRWSPAGRASLSLRRTCWPGRSRRLLLRPGGG